MVWLREQAYDVPVLNRVGVDLGPGVDAALGWTWHPSGFVLVNMSWLP